MQLPKKFIDGNKFPSASKFWQGRVGKNALTLAVAIGLIFAATPQNLSAFQDAQTSQDAQGVQPGQTAAAGTAAPAYTTQTPAQLQQLVAPIALYPDSLVAQILAASTFPAEIVEADRWVQNNSTLKGDALAQAVDQQSWDPSVKALTAFPSVLGNMDKNLSWTSSLGDAYYNQQQDVMDAVQVMRQKAQSSGNLQTTDQQTVQTQGSTIVIQPANPQVVYVPAYNPWLVYGGPISPWPYWYNYPGIWWGGPNLSFGIGFGIGFFGGYGWGWNHWGTNWGGHTVVFNHNTYYSHSNTFYNRNNYYHNGGARGVANNVNRGMNGDHGRDNVGRNGAGEQHPGGDRGRTDTAGGRGGVYNHPGATNHPFNGNSQAARGYGQAHTQTNTRSGAFSGYNHGGESRSNSSRGSQSFGGGGGGGNRGGGGGGGRHR